MSLDLPATLVSVEEYLRSSFDDGDREYVDGIIVERNLGEQDHSWVQGELIAFFHGLRPTFHTREHAVEATDELRMSDPDVALPLATLW